MSCRRTRSASRSPGFPRLSRIPPFGRCATSVVLATAAAWGGLAGCGDAPDAPAPATTPAPAAAAAAPADTAAAATAATAAATPTPTGPRVIFLGDSLTAGFGLSGDEAFPAVVERRLAASGQPFQLVNAGVSGDTTAGGQRRLDWLLNQNPAVVVVGLGANDGLRGLSIEQSEANLMDIVTRIQAAGARPVLLGMRIPTNYGPAYTEAFFGMYERIAAATGAERIPFLLEGVGGVASLNLDDGIHPNRAGHEKIADTVTPVLASVLASVVAGAEASGSADPASEIGHKNDRDASAANPPAGSP
ncbi:MAG: arylesterase [Phycisphaerales bacterium]